MMRKRPNEQSQEGAEGSTNIQAGGDIHYGLNYVQVRQIFMDLFKSNFTRMRDQAAEIAQERVQKLLDDFLQEMADREHQEVPDASNPDFQVSVTRAQGTYARSGDLNLEQLLVQLLADRAETTSRDLEQIVLNESIETAGKLTSNQLNILTLVWIVRYVPFKASTVDAVCESWRQYILPLAHIVKVTESNCAHLAYASCADIELGEASAGRILQHFYSGIFSADTSSEETKIMVLDKEPALAIVFDVWDNSQLKNLSLTTVGIALAHANARQLLGLNSDLSLWIQ